MKFKMITAFAAMTLAAGAAYAATEMKDCCKDKECSCCDHDKADGDKQKAGEHMDHHQH